MLTKSVCELKNKVNELLKVSSPIRRQCLLGAIIRYFAQIGLIEQDLT